MMLTALSSTAATGDGIEDRRTAPRRAEQPARQIHAVRAEIDHRAAAARHRVEEVLGQPVAQRAVVRNADAHERDVAERARIEHRSGVHQRPDRAPRKRDGETDRRSAHGGGNRVSVVQARGEHLLGEHVFAGACAAPADQLEMPIRRRRDHHAVDVASREQRRVVRDEVDSEFSSPLCGRVPDFRPIPRRRARPDGRSPPLHTRQRARASD